MHQLLSMTAFVSSGGESMRRPLREYSIAFLSACLINAPMFALKSLSAPVKHTKQQRKSPPLNS
jgi:hypothetical protein